MNKAELIAAIAAESGLTKSDAGKALDAFEIAVTGALNEDGDKVSLIGFGTWSVVHRPARKGRNPQSKTNEVIDIAAKNVVKFKAGAKLARSVN